jgi:hypothetical protein
MHPPLLGCTVGECAGCSTTPSRSISSTPLSRAPLSPGGASVTESRPLAAYFRCGRMSRCRGLAQGDVDVREIQAELMPQLQKRTSVCSRQLRNRPIINRISLVAALRAHQPIAPVGHGRLGAVALGHFGPWLSHPRTSGYARQAPWKRPFCTVPLTCARTSKSIPASGCAVSRACFHWSGIMRGRPTAIRRYYPTVWRARRFRAAPPPPASGSSSGTGLPHSSARHVRVQVFSTFHIRKAGAWITPFRFL